MYPQNSGGWSKFPGRLKLRPSIAQTAFVRVVTPRHLSQIKPQKKLLVLINQSFEVILEMQKQMMTWNHKEKLQGYLY